MTTNRQVRITGTIRNSAGNPLRGRLVVNLLAPLIDTSTTPHSTLTPEIQSYDIEAREGNLNIKLYESETDSIPYSFKFYSIKENGANGGLLFPEFNTIVSDVEKIDWDNLIPTAIIPDELDLGANRVATLLGQEPYLSTIISGSSSINLTTEFTVPANLSGVTVAPSIAFIADGQSATGQIAGIPAKISRSGTTYTLNRITPGSSTLIAANTRFFIAPLLNSNIAYISASATIAVSGATTVSIAPTDFLANGSSVTGVLENVFGTLARSGSTYTFTPYIQIASTVSVDSGDVFYVSSPPGKDAKATITANATIAVSGATTIAIAPINYIADGDSLAGSIKGAYGTLTRSSSTYTFTPSTTLGSTVAVTAFVDEFIPGGAPGTAGKDGVATITANATIAVSGGTTLAIAPADYLGDGGNITGVIKTAFGTLARSGSTYTFTPATTLGGTVGVTANVDKFFPAATPPAVSNPLTLGTAILDGTGNKLTVNRPVYDTEVLNLSNINLYGYSYAIVDANNKLAFGILPDGTVSLGSLLTNGVSNTGNSALTGNQSIGGTLTVTGLTTFNGAVIANSNFNIGAASLSVVNSSLRSNLPVFDTETKQNDQFSFTGYPYAITDANLKLAFGIRADGTTEINTVSSSSITSTTIRATDFKASSIKDAVNDGTLLYIQQEDGNSKTQIYTWNPSTRVTNQITNTGNNYPVSYLGSILYFVSDRGYSNGFGFDYYQTDSTGTYKIPYDYQSSYFGTNKYYGILISGQSLSTGFDSMPALSTTQNYNNLMFNTGVRAGSVSGANTLVPLVEADASPRGETIATSMTNRLSSLINTRGLTIGGGLDFVASVNGLDATAYTGIKKGTTPYNQGMQHVTQGKAKVEALGKTYNLPVVCLLHGETDEQNSNTSYDANLLEFWTDYNTDIKAITSQTNDIKMLLCQNHNWQRYKNPAVPTIAIAQLKACEDNPTKIFMVTPKYIFTYTDGTHLTNTSERHLAEYYAKVYEEVVIKGKEWKPLSPKTITRNANIITIVFNVPKPPIVFDTTLITSQTNFGFEYTDDTSSATISSVVITAPDTVQITLSGTPTGANKKVRYAYTGTYLSLLSPRGNLRDSDSYPSLVGNRLYNWCVTFDKAVS